jgi:hypothetical protein
VEGEPRETAEQVLAERRRQDAEQVVRSASQPAA